MIVEAIRGTLTGNRDALERLFDADVSAAAPSAGRSSWCRATLRLRGQVAAVRVSGAQADGARGRRSLLRRRRPLGDDDRAGRRRRAPRRRRRRAGARRPARRAAPHGRRARRRASGSLGVWLRRRSSSPIARSHYVADLSAFLPSAPTRRAGGAARPAAERRAARLVLIGIEGGDAGARAPTRRAQLGRARCARAARFESVHNGDNASPRPTPAASCSSTATC